MHGDSSKSISLTKIQRAEFGPANTSCVLQQRLEDRRELAGDELMTRNTSDVADCCSNDSRCSSQQPRILNRDHRLVGEGGDQLELVVGKWFHLMADSERTRRSSLSLAQERHSERAS